MSNAIPSRITAVQDRLKLSVADVKGALGIDDCMDDDLILVSIDAAKAAADAYMNNPFWASADLSYDDTANWDGNRVSPDLSTTGGLSSDSGRLDNDVPDIWADPRVELDIPATVRLGVIKYAELMVFGAPEGTAKERVGDWQVDYIAFVSNTDKAAFIKSTYWDAYVLVVGF